MCWQAEGFEKKKSTLLGNKLLQSILMEYQGECNDTETTCWLGFVFSFRNTPQVVWVTRTKNLLACNGTNFYFVAFDIVLSHLDNYGHSTKIYQLNGKHLRVIWVGNVDVFSEQYLMNCWIIIWKFNLSWKMFL